MHHLTTQFWSSTIDGLELGAIYGLVALGYTLVYGVLKLINFAHSEIFMIGTFATLFTMHGLGVEHAQSGFALAGVLVACIIAAMLASGTAAVVLERIAYRPLRRRGASRLAALISAIGASLFLQELFAERYGRDYSAFPRVMTKSVLFRIGDGQVTNDKLLVFGGALIMMVILDRVVRGTRLGRGIRATAQDPETAVLMGVNIDRVVSATFVLGGIMAGAAAALFSVRFETTRYDIGFLLGVKAFTAAVLGGIGNVRGALLGGLVIGLIENYGASVWGSQWRDVISFVVLVMILMFRPTGLLGESLARGRA
ncbi:MAG: branched-chain amino acid ABC transporter permease [Acidimicrobiales bacterium]